MWTEDGWLVYKIYISEEYQQRTRACLPACSVRSTVSFRLVLRGSFSCRAVAMRCGDGGVRSTRSETVENFHTRALVSHRSARLLLNCCV